MRVSLVGRYLLLSVGALTAIGGFLADLNKTHIFNPRWTPHAKFHDAMTILLALMLGTSSIVLLQSKLGDKKFGLQLGAALPSFFWASMLGSFLFPGAKGLESEFPEKVKKIGSVSMNEGVAAILMLGLLAAGYSMEEKYIESSL